MRELVLCNEELYYTGIELISDEEHPFNGGAYIQDIEGNYITIPNKSYKQVSFKYIEFINHNNNWQFISHL